MNTNTYKFESKLWRIPDSTAAYVICPFDIKKVFGRGSVYVHATIENVSFDCSIMNRGHKHYEDRPTYTISINRERLLQLGKMWGDTVTITVREREKEKYCRER